MKSAPMRLAQRKSWLALACLLLLPLYTATNTYADTIRATALAEFGEPANPPDFPYFRYVNPNAPKGGQITLAEPGSFSVQASFDTLNSLPLGGALAGSVRLIYESLFVSSADEIGVLYAGMAASVEYPDDRSWAIFTLRPQARWHDGVAITAGDVAFTFEKVRQYGDPFQKSFLREVEGVEVLDDHQVRFTFSTRNRMKPLLNVAGLSIRPRHWWTSNGRDISKSTLELPLGSGPYRLTAIDPGRSLTYERVQDYWGSSLPVSKGQDNFDSIRVIYFRDDDVRYQAFLAGTYDARQENRAQRWAQGYDVPAVQDKRIIRLSLPDERPKGAQGIRWNTRRATLADPRVREALAWLFDFTWVQRTILSGQYARTQSNFPNSPFGADGAPTAQEISLLAQFAPQLDPRVQTQAFVPPSGDGSGQDRAATRQALKLLREAGWDVKNGRMTHTVTKEPMTIEILEGDSSLQRVVQPYIETLRRVGINASARIVDSAQYQARVDDFDFDAVIVNFNFFPPPGPELRSYFGSAAATEKGSANYSGIRDPVVDALIEQVIAARDIEETKIASRALDRVLLWGWYMMPQWYSNQTWIACWDRFGRPEVQPRFGSGYFSTWWYDAEKAGRAQPR